MKHFNVSEEIKKDIKELTKKYKKRKIDDKTETYMEEFLK